MYSLPRTDLNPSKVSALLLSLVIFCYLILLQVFWVPAALRAFLYVLVLVFIVLYFFDVFCKRKAQISIEQQVVSLIEWRTSSNKAVRTSSLRFVRANAVQLIACVQDENERWFHRVWPSYKVIFYDSLNADQYAQLRSFAAQQIVLNRDFEK